MREGLAHGGHPGDAHAGLLPLVVPLLPVVLVALAWLGYLWLAAHTRTGQPWPRRRTAAATVGLVLLAVGLSPAVDAAADADFSIHAAQHLVVAMVAPLAVVLAMPVTLLLVALPHPVARRLGRLLGSRPVHLLTTPAVALALSSGGLVVLYLTPLYRWSTEHDGVHLLVHAHLVAAGLLFAWVVAGLDPAPRRASVRVRLVTLGAAIVVHATVSQLLYAGLLVQVREPVEQMRAAGNLMYLGGDLAELLLALALLVTARPAPGQGPRRRAGRPALVTTTPAATASSDRAPA